MGLFNGKNKDGNLKTMMQYEEGLPGVQRGTYFDLILNTKNESLEIKEKYSKNKAEFFLAFNKIISVDKFTENEIKEKSGVGRAVAGGLLFGSTGAIVGAATAKDKKKVIVYYVIKYTSSNEEKSILLKSCGDTFDLKFYRNLFEIVNPKNEMSNGPIEL